MIGRNRLSVLGIIFGVCLVILLLLLFFIAKTGLLTIPVFSRLYHGPQPVRVIQAQPMASNIFYEKMNVRLRTLAATQKPPYNLLLDESDLTAALEGSMKDAIQKGWKINAVQLAVEPDVVELYGRFEKDALHLDTRLHFKIVVQDTTVRFDVQEAQVGDISVPLRWVDRLASLVFSRDLGTFQLQTGDLRLLQLIQQRGSITLVVEPRSL